MGRQYGYLLKGPMGDFYQIALQNLKMNHSRIKTISDFIYNNNNKYMQEFISGMAETSGFTLEKQKIICSLVSLTFIDSRVNPGCSSMSAWGDYTGGKPLVIGRNWDYGHPFPLFKKFVVFVVYKPTGSPNIVADVNYIGVTSYVPTSLNSSGIYVDWHTGRLSDPTSSKDYQHHYSYIGMILDAIFNFSSITEFENELLDRANLPPAAIILNVADANECRVYELATYDAKMRMGNGLIVSSNHFIHPGWTGLPGIPAGPRSSFSRERIANLRALGERFKGNIDAVRMMEIFDRTLYEGGPSFDEGTIFQVVTVPFKKMMWVKTPGFGHWNKIDLNPFFN